MKSFQRVESNRYPEIGASWASIADDSDKLHADDFHLKHFNGIQKENVQNNLFSKESL